MDELLVKILKYKRGYQTEGEQKFLQDVIETIPGIQSDEEQNYWLTIGETKTLFSCHTDTVHGNKACGDIYQHRQN